MNDEEGALEAYRKNFETKTSIGGADEYRSVQRAALILAHQQKFDEALETLHRIDLEKTKGYWLHSSLLTLGDIYQLAGKKNQALEVWKKVEGDREASKSHRETAEKSIKTQLDSDGIEKAK